MQLFQRLLGERAFLPTPLSIHLYNYDSNIKYFKQLLCYLRQSKLLANKSLGFVLFIWLVHKDFKHRLNVCQWTKTKQVDSNVLWDSFMGDILQQSWLDFYMSFTLATYTKMEYALHLEKFESTSLLHGEVKCVVILSSILSLVFTACNVLQHILPNC